jgi:phosphatidylserine/phosphatidylglycerophosphate/cardiolipin synthase-like enzyme
MPTYKIDYGDAVMEGGLFLTQVPRPAPQTKPYENGRGAFFQHLSTFPDRSTIKEEVLTLLRTAQRCIFFASFLIQDEEVTEALMDSAKRLKGHVYVLTTLKDQDFEALHLASAEADDDGPSFSEHREHVEQLARNGIPVKARKDCHAKFMVTDDKYAIITSANAVPTCYVDIRQSNGATRPANPENGVLLRIPSEVHRLGNFFRAIWRAGANYYVSPDPLVSTIRDLTEETVPISCAEPLQPANEGEVLWTAPNDCRILAAMVRMIKEADDRVRISSFGIKGIEHHALGKALAEAANRGVEVEILVRRMPRERLRSCCQLSNLLGKRLTILGDRGNHSKAVVVDDKAAMVLTANLDAEHGLDGGVEVGFYSRRPAFRKAVAAFLDEVKSNADHEFVPDPTQEQAYERTPAPPNLGLGKNLHLQISPAWSPRNRQEIVGRLVSEMKTQLVRVSAGDPHDKSQILLLTDTFTVHCRKDKASRFLVTQIDEVPAKESDARFYGLLPRAAITITAD